MRTSPAASASGDAPGRLVRARGVTGEIFVHDIVWNHALCTIKEHVEQRADYPKSRSSGDVS